MNFVFLLLFEEYFAGSFEFFIIKTCFFVGKIIVFRMILREFVFNKYFYKKLQKYL